MTEQNDKYNTTVQVSDVMLRKYFCVKNLSRHVIDKQSKNLQAGNCARVSVKAGRAKRSKR